MRNRILVTLIVLALATLACQLTSSVALQIANHPQPELPAPSLAPFEAAGCTFNENGYAECPPDSPFAALGCDQLRAPHDLLGGLDPTYPLALCLYLPFQHQNPAQGDPFSAPHFYNNGCMMPALVRYVIFKDGNFEMLSTMDELSAVYAPLESPDEALSYSLAATGLSAYYGLQRQLGFRYFVDKLEDTHVRQVDGSYQINLYDYQVCGCGPHTTSIVTVQVSPDGVIQTLSEQPAYENPAEDGLCVD